MEGAKHFGVVLVLVLYKIGELSEMSAFFHAAVFGKNEISGSKNFSSKQLKLFCQRRLFQEVFLF